jgi:16S rRNA (guanine527-N7)-methyltransferase
MNYVDLQEKLYKLGINLTERMMEQFKIYADFLIEKNNHFNLTAITELDEIIEKHFYDSALPVTVFEFSDQKIIDIGTGAGFPGVVLKIVYPDLKLTLLESNHKKCDFLNELLEKLAIKDVEVVWERAEIYGLTHREEFDVAITRAVASLPIVLELSTPLVKVQGYIIAMKGKNYEEELNNSLQAIKKLNIWFLHSYTSYLPSDFAEHTNLLFQKDGVTNKKYPRPFAIIKRRPL